MNLTDTLRLLILNDSRSEVERLVSMLRNAGVAVRTQHVESPEALSKLLQEQTWDLLIGHDQTKNMPTASAAKEISRLNLDIPVILITESEGSQAVVEGIRTGASDVVLLDDDQHLLLIIEREVKNREQRQARRVADRKRREAEQRALDLLDRSKDAIAYIQDGMFVYVNQSWADLLKYDDLDDLSLMPFIDLITDDDQGKFKSVLKNFNARNYEQTDETLSVAMLTSDDKPVDLPLTISLGNFDNEACVLITCKDAPVLAQPQGAKQPAEVKARAEENSQLKLRDLATGLPNRPALFQRLEKTLNDCTGTGATSAFLLISVADYERRVVANLGIRQADQVLKELAQRLRDLLPEDAFVGRVSEASLGLIIPSTSAYKVQELAQSIVSFVAEQIIEVKTRTVHVRVQIGISLITEILESSDQIADNARLALNSVREQDDNQEGGYHLYEIVEVEQEVTKETGLTTALQSAIDNDRLHLLFQPIIGLRSSNEEQYEVLLRVQDETGQQVNNLELFHAVDNPEILGKLDRWVVLEAAKKLAEQRARGSNTRLLINLSQAVFQDPSLPSWLKVALKAAELPADSIIFQLKESDVTTHLTRAKAFTDAVKKNGTPISITNFGCALNPMNTLKHVNADFIKIDGSYTRELQENTESSGLTNLVRDLHNQKKITIVPLVENASALSKLWQAGVHYIQGYYLQEPHSQMNYDFDMDE